MTHIDPFAPADSPQHPANWNRVAEERVEDTLANLYQWRRDHFAMASEAGQDIAPEELEDRHVRYGYLLDEYGAPEEQDNDPFVAQPVLLRRSVWHDLEDVEIDDWKRLFELHSTDDERDPAWVDRPMPDLSELKARDAVAAASAGQQSQEKAAAELPEVPKSTALKEEWVEFALAMERHNGAELSEEDVERISGMSVANLKAAYKPKDA